MPKGGVCEHRRCDGGPCRMLTPEEIEPSEEDFEEAEALVAEGWYSTSNKGRRIARFTEPVPRIEWFVSAGHLATPHGRRLKKLWDGKWHPGDLRTNDAGIERRELSFKLFRAFKLSGGRSA